MKSFRNPKYLDRHEDVVFDLEQALDVAPEMILTRQDNISFITK